MFSEPDRTSPEAFVAALPSSARRAAVQAALVGLQPNDMILANSISTAPVVLGMILTQTAAFPDFAAPYGLATAVDYPKRFVPSF